MRHRWTLAVALRLIAPQTCAAPLAAQPWPVPRVWACADVAGAPLTPAARLVDQPAGVRVLVPARGHPLYGTPRTWAWVERDGVCLGTLTRWPGATTWTAERLLPDAPGSDTTRWVARTTPGGRYATTARSRGEGARWLWRTRPVPTTPER